jgi:carboxypeptidase Taq
MTKANSALREHLAEIEDLRVASGVLGWDQQTMMPPRGANSRAEALATLERISHEQFVATETGRLIDGARAALNGSDPSSDEARLVAVTERRWNKARQVPTTLAADMARAASLGQEAWVAARAANDFKAFIPHLERNIDLARQYIDCFDGFDCAYDVLLDNFDPGMRTAEVQRLFTELKAGLVPLIATVSERELDDSVLHTDVPLDRQRALVDEVVTLMGFDRRGWRLDDAVHPFATSLGGGDVRITTRWEEDYFPSALFGAMHECGHGL